MVLTAKAMDKALRRVAKPARKKVNESFFKSGPGEYGEGDVFIGVAVPDSRKVAKAFVAIPLAELSKALKSPVHEVRLTALILLVGRYRKADEGEQEKLFRFYLRHWKSVNNWDLVDGSTPYIVGPHVHNNGSGFLYDWARSKNLWKRRIAIMGTFYSIQQKEFKDALAISRILLKDEHDLIHKAVGWMLREVGNRDRKAEERFLKRHYKTMPRTMLRYAIEKFPEPRRKAYLKGLI